MKHIKLYEGYIKDEINNFLNKLKLDVDTYIFSVTDDLQSTSEEDSIELNYKSIIIYYKNIEVEPDEFLEYVDKLKRISKILEKEFDASLTFEIIAKSNKGRTNSYGFRSPYELNLNQVNVNRLVNLSYSEGMINKIFSNIKIIIQV